MNSANKYKVHRFVLASGERYCLLLDRATGLPLFYPNLYVTTQVRNRSLSLAAMQAALSAIQVLLNLCDEQAIDLVSRFRDGKLLAINEFDSIRDACQTRLDQHFPERRSDINDVATITEYNRLSDISKYCVWLAQVVGSDISDQELMNLQNRFETRRPPAKRRTQLKRRKALTDQQLDLLFEVIRPGSQFNPFKDEDIQVRNRLIVLLLVHLGQRGGEILNLRLCDFDWGNNQLVIARRADEPSDPRTDQPLVKTLDHMLWIHSQLTSAIRDYCILFRKKIPNARRHDYLFVTHKKGPYQGQPLSKSGFRRVIQDIASTLPQLGVLHGHLFRHTWNDRFSRHMDSMDNPPSERIQETIRSYLQGWMPDSGTSATYNKRFVEQKAMQAGLAMQQSIINSPSTLK